MQMMIVPFEFLEIPIPVNYYAQLTTLYGDWHKIVIGDYSYEELIIDVDKTYFEYL